MTFQELQSLLSGLIGEPVTRKFIAGNTIILWFKSGRTKGFWIAPPWRIEAEGKIETTSAEIPWEPEETEGQDNFTKRFNAACSCSDELKSAKLISVIVDLKTSDLHLGFDNGRVLKTFMVWLEDENWHFSDHETKRQYVVFAKGVEVRPLKAEQQGND